MDTDAARAAFQTGAINEAILEPSERANGWMILVRKADGTTERITDHSGLEKIYHSIDTATDAARELGFSRIRVEERF